MKLKKKNRVKREVFELNNKFRIESGQDPIPIPMELLPANYMGNYNPNLLNIRDDVSMNPSVMDQFHPHSFRMQTSIPQPTQAHPAFIESIPPSYLPPLAQNYSPEMSVINPPQLYPQNSQSQYPQNSQLQYPQNLQLQYPQSQGYIQPQYQNQQSPTNNQFGQSQMPQLNNVRKLKILVLYYLIFVIS